MSYLCGTVNINYSYFADFITRLPRSESLKILDFGCGNGEIVQLLRQKGIECCGVEPFFEGGSFDEVQTTELLERGIIHRVPESGEIPFPDKTFDLIISNQVLEHIADKEGVLNRLARVLKDDGFMHHHFPTRDAIREGHIGIPFVHRVARNQFRYWYTAFLRGLGFGYFKNGLSTKEWTTRQLAWIDRYCHYVWRKDLHALLEKSFIVSYHEIDYCRFRAAKRSLARFLLDRQFLAPLWERCFRRLGFVAMELRKQPEESNRV